MKRNEFIKILEIDNILAREILKELHIQKE